uniref:N-acetyltransferase domain-containing protein n=1 Tax=Panagrolaimus sp. ES5 TaxID=591445 RepID=A0AC34FEN3_9BILA
MSEISIDEVKLVMVDPKKDYDMIAEMFIHTFSQNEPMTRAAGAKPEDVVKIYHEIIEHALSQPYSVLAYLGDTCVGFSVNFISTDLSKNNGDPNLTFKNDLIEEIEKRNNKSHVCNRIEAVIDEIERSYSYFIPSCKKLFKLDVLFVDPKYGGKGIGTKLTQKSIDLARENKCDYLMSVASAYGSGHIFKKAGLKCVREIPFATFLDNDQQIFKELHDGNKTVKLISIKFKMTSITGLSPETSEMDMTDQLIFVAANREKHFDLVSEMFIQNFSQQAPLTRASGAKPEEIREAYLQILENSLNSPHSILAFINNKCIGWAFNYIIRDITENHDDPSLNVLTDFAEVIANIPLDNHRARRIVAVVDEIERNFSYFIPGCRSVFKLDILYLDILYVDPHYGGQGIATKLTEKAIQMALLNHCDCFMSVATNKKSAFIFSKLGLKCVREIPFDAFLENGEPFLQDFGDGNKSIRLMFLKLM